MAFVHNRFTGRSRVRGEAVQKSRNTFRTDTSHQRFRALDAFHPLLHPYVFVYVNALKPRSSDSDSPQWPTPRNQLRKGSRP